MLAALVIVAAAFAASVTMVAAAGNDAGSGRPIGHIPKSLKECQKADTKEFRCYGAYYAAKTFYQDRETVFADIRKMYDEDAYVKAECHQITHIIGRTAYKKYGGLDKAYETGDSFCWSGYYHGAIEQAITDIGNDRIAAQAPVVCESFAKKRPYSFDHYNCVHGLGHGLMAVAAYDLPKSLELCDVITNNWERQSCYGGAFMENVMVASRGDGTTAYFKDSEPLYPCTFVGRPYKEQCYLMQTSQVLQRNGYDFDKTFAECTKADEGFVETCYRSLGRDASGSTISDQARTIEICRKAPVYSGLYNCMLGAVRDFVSYYHSDKQALALCEAFNDESITEPCKQDVAIYYRVF